MTRLRQNSNYLSSFLSRHREKDLALKIPRRPSLHHCIERYLTLIDTRHFHIIQTEAEDTFEERSLIYSP